MDHTQLPTPEYLRKRLSYCPETGRMTWLHTRPEFIAIDGKRRDALCALWNKRYAGQFAGTPDSKGYLKATIDGKTYRFHRVAWAIYTGSWPVGEIDHIDGDRLNNRWSNLREVPHAVNMRNMNRKLGASGLRGVTQTYRNGKRRWIAQGHSFGERIYLGSFKTPEEAVAARRAWEKGRGFTEKHIAGRAA